MTISTSARRHLTAASFYDKNLNQAIEFLLRPPQTQAGGRRSTARMRVHGRGASGGPARAVRLGLSLEEQLRHRLISDDGVRIDEADSDCPQSTCASCVWLGSWNTASNPWAQPVIGDCRASDVCAPSAIACTIERPSPFPFAPVWPRANRAVS